MTVRPAIVRRRLAHLAAVLVQLRRLAAMAPEARSADPLAQLAAERALHVAAEAIFDVAGHLLAGRGHTVPSVYRELVPALARAGVLTDALAHRLAGLAGFRNLLVHDYADVDPSQVWALIDGRLADLEEAHAALSGIEELRGPD